MKNTNTIGTINSLLIWLPVLIFILIAPCCKHDNRLDKLVIHDNPLIKVSSKPEVLLDHLSDPAAPFFISNRIVFAESGKGNIYEYKDKKAISLISGFGIDNYAGYPISVLGLTTIPDKKLWIVAASQDSGHILMFDESTFPTTAGEGREIPMLRTDAMNPFAVLLAGKGKIIIASGGTKSVYQTNFDEVNPNPLKPVFNVETGVAGIAEDERTGDIYGAVIGSGKNDGSLVRWNPNADNIQLQTLAQGFSNLVGVVSMPGGLLLLLEFGAFGTAGSGRVLIVDPKNPGKSYPLLSGLDAPSGFALGPDNTLVISTFGNKQAASEGMLISLQIAPEKQ